MSRVLLVLSNSSVRDRAVAWVKNAPDGTRIEFKEPKRTLPQNDLMWAKLTDISKQATLGGEKYSPDDWKCIFMDALGQEMRFLPKLEGSGFVPIGMRSSELSKSEMTDLIEIIDAWAAKNGVVFHNEERAAA